MFLSNKLRKENIIEYILYMFQIQDIIRGYKYNIEIVYKEIVLKYQVEEEQKKEIYNWYKNIIDLMHNEGVCEKGHISIISNMIEELNDFHNKLLKSEDIKYNELYSKASYIINDYQRNKSENKLNVVELFINHLYWFFLQKISKKALLEDNILKLKDITNLMAYLSKRFMEYEEGRFELSFK